MATTTNYGWTTPNDTDLVKDGASAIRTLGQSIDTTFAELKGGTSGQMLTKASNTDLDLVWVTPEIGDITSITATSPLTGGGTTGAVTVGIQAGSTTQSGSLQLTDSTSSTSTTTAATPNSVKTSFDLADAAIPKSTVTTAGDVIYATGSSAVTRLGIGSAGQVLTVASGVPSWSTPASGGMTLLSTTTLSGASTTISITSTGYVELILECQDVSFTANGPMPTMIVNGDTTSSNYRNVWTGLTGTAGFQSGVSTTLAGMNLGLPGVNGYLGGTTANTWRINIPMPTVANRKIMTATVVYQTDSSTPGVVNNTCGALNTSAITSVAFYSISSTFSGGTVNVYGVK
jgi:hypothetical protein